MAKDHVQRSGGSGSDKPKAKEYSSLKFLRDIIEVVVPAIILFLIINQFIEHTVVPSGSMIPTIQIEDHFFLNKTAYWFHKPQRGDIVVFKPPASMCKTDFVKRLIGLPGEKIAIRHGIVYINDHPLKEPYITPDRAPIDDFGPYLIPDGRYFMMGDNRNNSRDSRYWGTVPLKDIRGKAWWRFWPLNQMGIIK